MKLIYFLRARIRKWLNEEIWMEDYIKAGLKLGKNCSIQPGVIFDISHCWLIEIENNVTIAPEAYLLAHDASTQLHLNHTKIGKVKIKDNCFIGARAIIMPNVTVGENSIIAAGSVVTKSIEKNSVVGGNPAKFIMHTDELIQKHTDLMKKSNIYDENYLIDEGITEEMKIKMSEDLDNSIGYIV